MRAVGIAGALMAVGAGGRGTVAAPPVDALPSTEELHQLFKDKQYQPLLQKLLRVLQLKGDAAGRYDKCELLLLKGDTHLQLREQSLATAAIAEAGKAIDDQKEAHKAAVPRATAMPGKRSH